MLKSSQTKADCHHTVRPQVESKRHYAVGPSFESDAVSFRVWAPDVEYLDLSLFFEETHSFCRHRMEKDEHGYHRIDLGAVANDTLYGFRFPHDDLVYPDPASWSQPSGPHGLSQVKIPSFAWSDESWQGVTKINQVIYELHVGTFTRAGTFSAAQEQLQELKRLGVTMIELMPVADFSGEFGWGYDGVNLFAPAHGYGTADELKSFINHAHSLDLAVILDVVYNHFGNDGNYALKFSRHYFSDRHKCEWGEALNFDGEQSSSVREFFIENARFWIEEYHFDGLRLDATQQIYDQSEEHVIKSIVDTIRGGSSKALFVVGENEPQEVDLIKNYGADALWNDDFHHCARVLLTGKKEGYFADYAGTAQELVSVIKRGFLYQGQLSVCRQKEHGTSTKGLKPNNLVCFIENHDQVANSGRGQRLYQVCDMASYRAMLTLLLLGPNTPMLFQGQEFASSAPFGYFADHQQPLADAVYEGRRDSMRRFRSTDNKKMLDSINRPDSKAFFDRCKLDFSDRQKNAETYSLTQELIRIRGKHATLWSNATVVDGAVLSPKAFCIRFDGEETILFLSNLGDDLQLYPASEPLLSAPAGNKWSRIISSEEPEYGGLGCPEVFNGLDIYLPARCSVAYLATN